MSEAKSSTGIKSRRQRRRFPADSRTRQVSGGCEMRPCRNQEPGTREALPGRAWAWGRRAPPLRERGSPGAKGTTSLKSTRCTWVPRGWPPPAMVLFMAPCGPPRAVRGQQAVVACAHLEEVAPELQGKRDGFQGQRALPCAGSCQPVPGRPRTQRRRQPVPTVNSSASPSVATSCFAERKQRVHVPQGSSGKAWRLPGTTGVKCWPSTSTQGHLPIFVFIIPDEFLIHSLSLFRGRMK